MTSRSLSTPLPDPRFLFCDTPGCGSSIDAKRGHAVKSDETSHLPSRKIDEITINNPELQILSEAIRKIVINIDDHRQN
jgi:hypothetical protein